MVASAPRSNRRPASRWNSFWRRIVTSPIETDLTDYWDLTERIADQETRDLTDATLRARAGALARRLCAETTPPAGTAATPILDPPTTDDLFSDLENNQPLQMSAPAIKIWGSEILIEAFSLVAEGARRALGLDPFDVQLIAGLAMAGGRIAELPTGEGKTLAAVFPAFLHALRGRGVHLLTFNDYLARRDAAWMGPVYHLLGLTVGVIQEGQALADKRAAYGADITYATAKEAGFDFLRDSQVGDKRQLVHRPFQAAIVDEADSILIDEARIPLVIADMEETDLKTPERLSAAVSELIPGRDFCVTLDQRSVTLTEAGLRRMEDRLGRGNLYEESNQDLFHAVHCALHARALLQRNVDYLVRDGRIVVIDEFTGRGVKNRHWPDGLQAAVEAKEGLTCCSRGRILGSIALQYLFRLYPHLCGMTATARPAATELNEFFRLGVTVIPPHTPSRRIDHPDAVFTHFAAKQRALVREIVRLAASRRPVIVGTASVRESEGLARELLRAGVACRLLNAKNDEAEARIIAEAGRPGSVTISTNMAGRGTDIKLGGQDESQRAAVLALGGLMVIGTNRHESLRIDHQLRGRAGRQGDPGESRFFISLEDDLFSRTGLGSVFLERHRFHRSESPVDAPRLSQEIEHAQRVFEGTNTSIRRSLRSFSSLVEIQRRIIHRWRQELLHAPGTTDLLRQCDPALLEEGAARLGPEIMEELQRQVALQHLDRSWAEHLAWVQDTRESIHLVKLGGLKPIYEFQKQVTAAFFDWTEDLSRKVAQEINTIIREQRPAAVELERLKGPSSTWTYLINENQFGLGIEMLLGGCSATAAAAALFTGPLFVWMLIADRLTRRKRFRMKTDQQASQ